MKKHLLFLLMTWGLLGLLATACTAEEKAVKLESLEEKISYTIGLQIGQDMKNQEVDIRPDLVAQGIRDALSEAEPRLTQEEMQTAFMTLQTQLVEKQQERRKAEAEQNKKAGEAFLAENIKKEGVKSLPSGLQYKVLEKGTGPSPQKGDTVMVHYEGRLIDGTVFDSSFERGEPATFPVMGVIPGWTEALQQMKEGAKWQIYIPANLAYGERGAGQAIGPNATLIFDVELLEVNPGSDNAAGQESSSKQ